MGDERGKVTGIRQIVRLREFLQRWQSFTFRPKPGAGADDPRRPPDAAGGGGGGEGDSQRPLLAPAAAAATKAARMDRRLKGVVEQWESDEEGGCRSPEPPADVPRGCCPVYVGVERRRFVVPTAYLGMPVFRRLLEKAEEEFGFAYLDGALTIPCETETFKFILQVMERHRRGLVDDEGNPTGAEESSSKEVWSSEDQQH